MIASKREWRRSAWPALMFLALMLGVGVLAAERLAPDPLLLAVGAGMVAKALLAAAWLAWPRALPPPPPTDRNTP